MTAIYSVTLWKECRDSTTKTPPKYRRTTGKIHGLLQRQGEEGQCSFSSVSIYSHLFLQPTAHTLSVKLLQLAVAFAELVALPISC